MFGVKVCDINDSSPTDIIEHICQELSDLKKVHRDTTKNEIEELISTITHELRAPLTGIQGSLQLVLTGVTGELHEDSREMLEIADKCSGRLNTLITDLLDLHKMESGKMTFNMLPIDIVNFSRESIHGNKILCQAKRITLNILAKIDAATVLIDEFWLHQVFSNFLSNAVKFSPDNGEIKVEISQQAERIKVSVRDEGTGIPDEFKTEIFKRFSQAKHTKGGTGLGLSICKVIIESHGGEIGYVSEEGNGAEFYFLLAIVSSESS